MSRFRPGQLSAGDAAALNAIAAKVEGLSRMTVAPPLSITKNAGIPLISTQYSETILAEITEDDGGDPPVYTAKRKTREGLDPAELNTVIDFVPETLYEQVLNPLAGDAIPSAAPTWAAGTVVELVPIADWKGWYWGFVVPEEPGFFAQLVETDGTAWKYKPMVLFSGAWTVGPVSDDFSAIQLPQMDYPTGVIASPSDVTPVPGMRVRMQPVEDAEGGPYKYGFVTPLPRAGFGDGGAGTQLGHGRGNDIGTSASCHLTYVDLPSAGTYLLLGSVSGYAWYTVGDGCVLSAGFGVFGSGTFAGPIVAAAIAPAPVGGLVGGTAFVQNVFVATGPTRVELGATVSQWSFASDYNAVITSASASYITLASADVVSPAAFASCSGSGSGSGSGGGGDCSETSITATAAGTASGTGTTSATATLSGITVPACATLIVQVGVWSDGGAPSTDGPTFAGAAMGYLGTSASSGGTPPFGLFTFYARSMIDMTGDVVLSVTGGTTGTVALLTASYVTALSPALDASAGADGTSSDPDSGTTGSTTVAATYVTGAAIYTETAGGTWQNGFSDVQSVTAGGVTLREGYQIASATGTFDAAILFGDGGVPVWGCLAGAIK